MILFCGMYFFRIFAGKTIKLIKTNIKKQGNNNVNVCLMSHIEYVRVRRLAVLDTP